MDDEDDEQSFFDTLIERHDLKPRYYVVHQIDGTCNIVLGNPYLNPPAVKTGLTREEAAAFMKLLK